MHEANIKFTINLCKHHDKQMLYKIFLMVLCEVITDKLLIFVTLVFSFIHKSIIKEYIFYNVKLPGKKLVAIALTICWTFDKIGNSVNKCLSFVYRICLMKYKNTH